MRILLDSNAYSAFMRGNHEVRELIHAAEEVLFSAVVVGEQLFGFRQGARFEQNLAELRSFLERPYVSFVPVGPVTADRYSRVMTLLKAKGRQFRQTTFGLRPTRWRRVLISFQPINISSMSMGLCGSGLGRAKAEHSDQAKVSP